MILGLSHIAFSSDDIDAATERLTWFGYVPRFDEPVLENHPAKAPFLTQRQPQHHIRALAADGAMAIELLDHGGLAGPQTSGLIPIFCSEFPCPGWQPRILDSLPISSDGLNSLRNTLGQVPQAFHDPVLSMTLLWIAASDKPAGLHACAVPTKYPKGVTSLLTQLRFRSDATGIWTLLTPLPALQARLIPVSSVPAQGWAAEPLLDAPGCGCLALMARRTEHTRIPFAFQDKTVSFTLPVNGKNSRITLGRPENGPIIELVDQHT